LIILLRFSTEDVPGVDYTVRLLLCFPIVKHAFCMFQNCILVGNLYNLATCFYCFPVTVFTDYTYFYFTKIDFTCNACQYQPVSVYVSG
jgi:hypothetical protein